MYYRRSTLTQSNVVCYCCYQCLETSSPVRRIDREDFLRNKNIFVSLYILYKQHFKTTDTGKYLKKTIQQLFGHLIGSKLIEKKNINNSCIIYIVSLNFEDNVHNYLLTMFTAIVVTQLPKIAVIISCGSRIKLIIC